MGPPKTPPKVVRPGDWPRSRWEINGFSSAASPLVNCSNWQDALKREATFQYKWGGLIPSEEEAKPERTGIWHELVKKPSQTGRSRTLDRPPRSGRHRSKMPSFDPSWDERVVEKVLHNTQECAKRATLKRRMDRARATLAPRTINKHEAYRSPMPGYTGNRPVVRSPFENSGGATAAELYTVTKRDFNGFSVPGLNNLDHPRERDQHTEFRLQCSKYLGKASPHMNELGVPVPKRFNMHMCSNEYISRTVDDIQKLANMQS